MTTSDEQERADAHKTKKQLIEELQSLRHHLGKLEETGPAGAESEHLLHEILDSSPIGIDVSRTSDGAIIFFNTRLAELFGLDPDTEQPS